MKGTKEFSYEVVKAVGTFSEQNSYTKEVNIISWNGRSPSYDIRGWYTAQDGTKRALKGMSVTKEELIALIDLSAMENSMARMMLETINNMMIELYASMAQAEIEKKEKRQREGIEAKKARGEWDDYGRPRVMSLDEFSAHYRLVQQGEKKPFELMRELNMKKPTFYRYKAQLEKGC